MEKCIYDTHEKSIPNYAVGHCKVCKAGLCKSCGFKIKNRKYCNQHYKEKVEKEIVSEGVMKHFV